MDLSRKLKLLPRLPVLFPAALAAVAIVAVACGSDESAAAPTPTPNGSTATPPVETPTPTPAVTGEATATPVTPSKTPYNAEIQAALNAARARWDAARPGSYQFDLTWSCFCPYAGNAARITVTGKSITSAIDITTGNPASPEKNGPQNTIDELFDWIQTTLDTANARVLSAEYERDLGYPISASIDRIVGAIDDEGSFTISRFRAGTEAVDLDQLRRDLDSARNRWIDSGIENYQFVYRMLCFCPPEFMAPVSIQVRGGEVVSVTSVPTGEQRPGSGATIQGLFDWISERIDRDPEFADVRFDTETGYPKRATFDFHINVIDDEESFFIDEMTPVNVHIDFQQELNGARARWESAHPTNYTFRFNWNCFCLQEFVAPVIITVRDGDVTDVIRVEDGEPVSEQFREDFVTIDALFDRLQDAIDRDAASINVEFSTEFGLPTSVFIDYRAIMADEEMGWNLSDLEAIE